jgi:hypothetical protein
MKFRPIDSERAKELLDKANKPRRASGPLRALLVQTAAAEGVSLNDLTVLSNQNDPFRVDTEAGHRDGQWLRDTAQALGLGDRKIHLRGLHYMVLGRPKPNGETYANTEEDWDWLSAGAGKAARWLGYIPFDQITDQRNTPPVVRLHTAANPYPYIHVGARIDVPPVEEMLPKVYVAGFVGAQPYKLVLVGEKSSLDGVLGPIADSYKADLYLPTGEPSDTLLYNMARIGADDGRPMIVLYFSDADPSGWQMPISVARKLQALKALGDVEIPTTDAYGNRGSTRVVSLGDLDFQVYRVALIPEQVREHDLPESVLKESEKRAGAWREAMGIEQTEIDALASLRPDLLREIARAALDPFYDWQLDARVAQARSAWQREAQADLERQLHPELLAEIRNEATEHLDAIREQVDALNDAMRLDVGDIELPDAVVPEPELNGQPSTEPLLDSDWSFASQCYKLRRSKSYEE